MRVWVDPNTGLTDHDARSYNAALRTWVTTDQYADPSQDLGLSLDPSNANRMLYAGGNPISNVDPDGHAHRTQGYSTAYVNRVAGNIQVNVLGNGGGSTYSFNYNNRGGMTAAQSAARKAAAVAATKARWQASAEYKRKQRVLAQRAANARRVAARSVAQRVPARAPDKYAACKVPGGYRADCLNGGGVQSDPIAEAIIVPFGGLATLGVRGAVRGATNTVRAVRAGREPTIGGIRVAPLGNSTGHPIGRYPHYHRGVPDPARPGNSLPGQGANRHRPWETKSTDAGFWDRF
jgi:RHS repeat-associated protein